MRYLKSAIVCLIVICYSNFLQAQTGYVLHTLKQGETLSALAKQYNTNVGDIMRMNGMHADSKLSYGSKIKIPSSKKQTAVAAKTNDAVVNTPPAAASSGEVTHIVAKGETLYSISKKFNVSVDKLKAWNNLTDNSAKLGTLLIVNESGVSKMAKTQKPKTEVAAAPEQPKEPVVETKPDSKPPAPAEDASNSFEPAMQTVTNVANASPADITTYSGNGFFADQFKEKKSKNTQNISGVSKTFKTASGWSDGKFYILANNIEPGTIVKLTADNGNSVYAKVLWNMGDLKDNAGIDFRVSNATAAALRENTESFNLSISF